MVKKQKLLLPGGRFPYPSACASLILILGNAHEGKGILPDAILSDDSLFCRLIIHDWERREYKQLVDNVGFSIER